MEKEQLWPYVLPFPTKPEKRQLIWRILQSKVGLTILTKIKLKGRTYQQELIQKTPYSNKSIIEYLKQMVKANILQQGKEKTPNKKWVKWYTPTKLGKWLILFLKPPEKIPTKQKREAIQELFALYSQSIVKLCQKYKININTFHQTLTQHYLKEATKTTKQKKEKELQ